MTLTPEQVVEDLCELIEIITNQYFLDHPEFGRRILLTHLAEACEIIRNDSETEVDQIDEDECDEEDMG